MIKSNAKMPISRVVKTYHSEHEPPRCASVFTKESATGEEYYGCRFFEDGVFTRDEFYPEKTMSWAEIQAKSWIEGK